MHYSSTCPICRGLPVDGSMSDEAFHAFLGDCRDELAVKQADFQKRIAGAPQWHYEMAEASLAFGEMRFGITPIGTYSPEQLDAIGFFRCPSEGAEPVLYLAVHERRHETLNND